MQFSFQTVCHSNLLKDLPERQRDILDRRFGLAGEKQTFMRGIGCDYCNGTGYHGRVRINEVMLVDDEIRDSFLRRASTSDLRKLAIKKGMTPMLIDGFNKAAMGITTVEEILRVIHE